jgi:hypothetical protein
LILTTNGLALEMYEIQASFVLEIPGVDAADPGGNVVEILR